jgi:Skp family chaperone for outer membrane proteins
MNGKTLGLLALVSIFASVVSAASTWLVLSLASPQPVQAAPDHKELRIAIVNLETLCRATPKFKACKMDWDDAQAELAAWNKSLERDYKRKVNEIQRSLIADPDADVLDLLVEAQALEEMLKAAKEEQSEYLGALLAQYQQEVIEDVYANLQRYVRQQGYNLVLQDYDTAAPDADFFSGEAYAQSMMSKAVLDAPWALDGDPHVTDITPVMIKFMRAGGVPEKDD